MTQTEKALHLRQLHFSGKLLILPNAWDETSARLVQAAGFRAVATASVATSLTHGYQDGEKIPWPALLALVSRMARAISLPLTVDIEHGFADGLEGLKENVTQVIDQGAVGVNIEDGKPGNQGIETVQEQCRRIETVRIAADKCGVPLVINARTDLFFQRPGNENNLADTVDRARAYLSAGADCIYPIMVNKYEHLQVLVSEINAPININLQKTISDLRRLESMGVSRVSLGPGFLYYALGRLLDVANDLREYDSARYFDHPPLSRDLISALLPPR